MLQRQAIALAHLKADQTSENVLHEISQIIYILYIEQNKLLKKYATI